MTNDKNEQPPKAGSSNRPTTIDLKATDITAAPEPAKPEPAAAQVAPEEPQAAPGDAPDSARSSAAAEPEIEAPRTEHARPMPDRAPSRSSFGAIAASVVGALLLFAVGLGAGHWLTREMAQRSGVSSPQAPVAAPSPELLERLAKLEALAGAPRATDPQLIARIAAAEATVKTTAEMAAARDRRNEEIAVLAREARDRAANAATVADEASQKARAASGEQPHAEIETLTTRLAALENLARSNQAEIAKRANATGDDPRSRLAISVLALRSAVDSGAPFATELAAVRSMSGDAKSIEALRPFSESGVPTAESLGRELQAVMPAIWKAALVDEPSDGGFLQRLQANAQKIVRVRPAGEAVGDDAGSVKARLELRAGNADIRGALIELGKLPPDARTPAQAWIKKAEARNAALAAAQSLVQSALAALAKPGS